MFPIICTNSLYIFIVWSQIMCVWKCCFLILNVLLWHWWRFRGVLFFWTYFIPAVMSIVIIVMYRFLWVCVDGPFFFFACFEWDEILCVYVGFVCNALYGVILVVGMLLLNISSFTYVIFWVHLDIHLLDKKTTMMSQNLWIFHCMYCKISLKSFTYHTVSKSLVKGSNIKIKPGIHSGPNTQIFRVKFIVFSIFVTQISCNWATFSYNKTIVIQCYYLQLRLLSLCNQLLFSKEWNESNEISWSGYS